MPALIKTDQMCTITWLGAVTHRAALEIETDQRPDGLTFGWDGVPDGAHSGRTRASDSRVLQQHAKGTEIANVRQVTLVSQDDLDHIAAALGLPTCDPAWLGANIVVQGLVDFSHIPPSSRLQADNGTTLIVDMQNFPCHQVGKTIERDAPGYGVKFKDVAKGRRGVTAWVERPGHVAVGDQLSLHVPSQRAWQPGHLGL
ncbi:MAG: MOSC domain-containing protein [Pseudomonadota bacterium]